MILGFESDSNPNRFEIEIEFESDSRSQLSTGNDSYSFLFRPENALICFPVVIDHESQIRTYSPFGFRNMIAVPYENKI